MNNLILSQVLGGLFGTARAGRTGGGSLGGGLGRAAIGGVLAGMLRNRAGRGGRGALIAMMLPFALQWIERNGGLGAVLRKVQQKGYARQADSWVSTGDNQSIDPDAVGDVIGEQDLASFAQQLGVPPEEVKQGFAEILPEMVNQLTPDGSVPQDADDILHRSIPLLEQDLRAAQDETVHH